MLFRVLHRAAVVLAFCGVMAGIGAPSAAQEGRPLQPIVEAVALRLTTADTVAASKWRSNAPIDDPAREERVLASVTAQALDEGLDAARVHQIFRDQIEANKDVQRALFAWWSVSPGSAPAIGPDLSQVRPVIDRQNTRISRSDAGATSSAGRNRLSTRTSRRRWCSRADSRPAAPSDVGACTRLSLRSGGTVTGAYTAVSRDRRPSARHAMNVPIAGFA
jgi:chorismate mutase-like protein